MSAPKYRNALSGKMLYPAPPRMIGAFSRVRQIATTSRTGGNRNLGQVMFWSSMLRTEIPMTPGWNAAMESRMADSVSASNMRFTRSTSWPALRHAAATQARPNGSGTMLVFSVFAETRRTFIWCGVASENLIGSRIR
jgi:hypothetical protein